MDDTMVILTGALTMVTAVAGYFLRRIPEELKTVSKAVVELTVEVERIHGMLAHGDDRMDRIEDRLVTVADKMAQSIERIGIVVGDLERRVGEIEEVSRG